MHVMTNPGIASVRANLLEPHCAGCGRSG
jgi:hypothetical protein